MTSDLTPFPPNRKTDLGALKKFPPEIRWEIYKFALPARILRFYRDHQKKHIFVEALAVPNLALACHDTWNFCLDHYSRVSFTPVYDCSGGQVPRINEPQAFDTWFCPSLDTLYFDTNGSRCFPRLKKLPPNADNVADDSSVQRFDYTGVTPGRDEWANTLSSLKPFTKKATSLVVGSVSDTFFYFCMNTELFPSLTDVFFAPGTFQPFNNTAWYQEVATYTQQNRAVIVTGQPPRRTMKIRPLYPSLTRYDTWLKKHVPLGDHSLQQKWDKVPDTFHNIGFTDDYRNHDSKLSVERMAAALKLYWDT
ncbi:hypothetical protein PG996_009906 [Apiospora saccharicola]|uniref:2EXR domain-containing protein n=1 Tax=Apiospora saccharicola TaxID=335842 RepID=A0ABR1UPJ9_9PEZI